MVTVFFFFSGYGIFQSYLRNDAYVKKFLLKRFLPVWISFAICVVLFIVENLCFGIQYSAFDIALSFTGWTSVGNSNWFMFVTFSLYIIFFLCFRFINREKMLIGLISFSFFSIALVVVLYFTKENYWYNTLLCFPLGMWYALYKDKIDSFVLKAPLRFFLTLLLCSIVFVSGYFLVKVNEVFYCFYSLAFSLCVVLVMMKIEFRSIPLKLLGKHIFSIYILQRIVFRFGDYFSLNSNPYLFFICTFFITLLVAFLYDYLYGKAFLLITNHIHRRVKEG